MKKIKHYIGFAKWADNYFKCDWRHIREILNTYSKEDIDKAFKFSRYNKG
jgi:hypothetical protein